MSAVNGPFEGMTSSRFSLSSSLDGVFCAQGGFKENKKEKREKKRWR